MVRAVAADLEFAVVYDFAVLLVLILREEIDARYLRKVYSQLES